MLLVFEVGLLVFKFIVRGRSDFCFFIFFYGKNVGWNFCFVLRWNGVFGIVLIVCEVFEGSLRCRIMVGCVLR